MMIICSTLGMMQYDCVAGGINYLVVKIK